jgi:PIN domain nuclease of toxin-antitoxin system
VVDWIAHTEAVPAIECVPIGNHLTLRSVDLPGPLHGDTADRLIVATARYLGMPLITKDRSAACDHRSGAGRTPGRTQIKLPP